MLEKEKRMRAVENARMKDYLKGKPKDCDKCGKSTNARYVRGDGTICGITLTKKGEKYFCQFCV